MMSRFQFLRGMGALAATGALLLPSGRAEGAAPAPAPAAPARPVAPLRLPITSARTDALIVIDVQNCFIPGGSLEVKKGNEVVPIINRLAKSFATVVLTQDWHTACHKSFASSHPGRKPFETIRMPYGDQVLWPDHCVQGTPGAEFAPGLSIPTAGLILRKGWNREVDSYSAFNEADRKPTGLAAYLRQRGINRIFLAGLATDFCVAWSATDARKANVTTAVIEDACRAIDLNGSLDAAWDDMIKAGVHRLQSTDIKAS